MQLADTTIDDNEDEVFSNLSCDKVVITLSELCGKTLRMSDKYIGFKISMISHYNITKL